MVNSYAILFDFDGVLMDTHHLHFLSRKQALGSVGVDLTLEEYVNKLNGMKRDRVIQIMVGADVTPEVIREISNLKQQASEQLLQDGYQLQLLDGVVDFVHYLQNKQIAYGIGSSSVNAKKFIELAGYSELFPHIITGDMVSQGKPHPETFTKLADILGHPYQDCIVIEDSRSGIQAAKSANMHTVGLTRSHDIGEDTGVDLLINDLSEYSSIISHFNL